MSESTNDEQYLLERSISYRVGISRVIHEDKISGFDSFKNKEFDFDITNMVKRFTIEESIYFNYRIATLVIEDIELYRELIPITGNEVFSIRYANSFSPQKLTPKTLRFRVFDVEEFSDPSKTRFQDGNKLIKFNLVEYPYFDMLTFNQIYKTYPVDENNSANLTVSNVLKDCLSQIEGFDKWCDMDFEESLSEFFQYWVPNWTGSKIISEMKKYAVSKQGNYGNYLFYFRSNPNDPSAIPKLVFRPHHLHIENKTPRKYGTAEPYETQRASQKDESLKLAGKIYTEDGPSLLSTQVNLYDIIESYKFNFFNASYLTFGKLSGHTHFNFDSIDDNKYYANEYKKWIKEEHKAFSPFCIHSHKGLPYGNAWSKFEISPWNRPTADNIVKWQDKNLYTKNTLQSGLRCTVNTKMFEYRSVGEVAKLYFPNPDLNRILDFLFSGTWLTEKIIDVYDGQKVSSIVTFVSDAFGMIDSSDYIEQIGKLTELTKSDADNAIKEK